MSNDLILHIVRSVKCRQPVKKTVEYFEPTCMGIICICWKLNVFDIMYIVKKVRIITISEQQEHKSEKK